MQVEGQNKINCRILFSQFILQYWGLGRTWQRNKFWAILLFRIFFKSEKIEALKNKVFHHKQFHHFLFCLFFLRFRSRLTLAFGQNLSDFCSHDIYEFLKNVPDYGNRSNFARGLVQPTLGYEKKYFGVWKKAHSSFSGPLYPGFLRYRHRLMSPILNFNK